MASGATDPAVGLTRDEAARRLREEGPNELPTAVRGGLARQVWDVVRQPMLFLLVCAGSINFLLSEPIDGALLMSFVLVVVGISIVQSHRTENALAALRELSSPRVLVVRDGEKLRIAGREVVRGDVILLSEGDRVPADAIVVENRMLSVDEAVLTGESVPVSKTQASNTATGMGLPGGDGNPWLFAGTMVVRGQAIAVVMAVGTRTELGRIGLVLGEIDVRETSLQREIDVLVRVVAAIAIVTALVVVIAYGLLKNGWLAGGLVAIATAMSMLPEEFPVVLTVFLALGAWRMSRERVLTRRAPVIETLGSATVVCVDKTGTLTMNRMEVRELFVDGNRYVLDDAPLPEKFHTLVEFAVLASPIDPFDPMDRAFTALAGQVLSESNHVHPDWQLVREYPLSEKLLALAHTWRSSDGGRFVVAAKGAPEAIGDLCHLDEAEQARLMAAVEVATADGLRVLAVARATFDDTRELPVDQHEFEFEFLGLTGLRDPVRPGVAEAVAEFTRAGVRTVMITGDYPGTAMAIAREVGLDMRDGCLTGPEVAAMSDSELSARVRTTGVFARMVPSQKLRLIDAFKANGDVVGMTGDGVNDVPALRASDIGIAMGARGTDVAREAADLVVIDDDFASIVSGVRHGRGIYDNLRKAMAYIVAVHVPIVGMVVLPLFFADWPLVLLPVQIAFLELIIDPTCSIVFESEEIDPQLMEQPPRLAGEPLFGARLIGISLAQGLSVFVAVFGVYRWGMWRSMEDDSVRSLTFAAMVLSNLSLILVNRSWRLPAWRIFAERRNPTLKWVLLGGIGMVVFVLTASWPRRAFSFGAIGVLDAVVAMVAALVGVSWFEAYKFLGHTRHGTAPPK